MYQVPQNDGIKKYTNVPSTLKLTSSCAAGDLYVRRGFLRIREIGRYDSVPSITISLSTIAIRGDKDDCFATGNTTGRREPATVVDRGSSSICAPK